MAQTPPALPATHPAPRSAWHQAGALALMFLGGGGLGLWLSVALAPDSWLATAAGMFSFPLAFVAGMQCWLGLALVLALWGLVRRGPRRPATGEIPSGSIAFVPVSVACIGLAGVVIALCGSRLGAAATVGIYLLLGLAYGVACWQLARSGYLPFPTE
jgi:hypothetical protein